MKRAAIALAFCLFVVSALEAQEAATAKRLLILKVDGLNQDLLFRTMQEQNPATDKPRLPWLNEIFTRHGTIFENFYTRGISLSAPSWSMLDTGFPLLIKGNVEYDRYTGRVYDYLNFFPFYLGYARQKQVDMPSVEVLDEAGVPLLSDAFAYGDRFQSFQLFQRGVNWKTLQRGLKQGLSSHALLSYVEDPQSGLGLGEGLAKEVEDELIDCLANNKVVYLDLFTGDVDHIGHSINDPKLLRDELTALDALAGRLWNAVQRSSLANKTVFAMVSDHGMNNVPSVYSQTFSLPDLLNSRIGGAHHVVTDRHQLSDYKLSGLDPLVFRVINPSTASLYLPEQADQYPTAWLDLDGNERASVGLRNSDLNRIHILLQQLSRSDLPMNLRPASARYFQFLIDRKRDAWQKTTQSLGAELGALAQAIKIRQQELKAQGKRRSVEQREQGVDKETRRKASELSHWVEERGKYENYLDHLKALLALHPSSIEPLRSKISDLIPEMSLGDPNSVYDLQHYVVGPSATGLVLNGFGEIDEALSFRHVDYFPLFASQVVRNNPQPELSPHPVDFSVTALTAEKVREHVSEKQPVTEAIWLYGDDEHQLVELVNRQSDSLQIRLIPVEHLSAAANGDLSWQTAEWKENFPFRLYEDPQLKLPEGAARSQWLNEWHSEREWMEAIHRCQYSNGVIGITEELRPPAEALPYHNPLTLMQQLELRRRNLVQADFHVFAADHWNFNVRNFNPGGNHGSFLRISTHSVWMMAGVGVPEGRKVDQPYDSFNFGSTVLHLVGKPVPLAGRVVSIGP